MTQTRSSSRRRPSRRPGPLSRRPLPVWLVAVLHFVALGVALVLFALPHHVIPHQGVSTGITTSRDTLAPAAEQSAEEARPALTLDQRIANARQTEVGQRVSSDFEDQFAQQLAALGGDAAAESSGSGPRAGDFSSKFAGKFSSEVSETDRSYVSPNLNVKINEFYVNGTRFYVADIYVRDISCFRTGLSKNKYGRNITENILKVAEREQSIVAINGDFYGIREGGVCVRNGELYFSGDVVREICVLYWDGSISCFAPEDFNCEQEVANGAYQIWNFGPALLDTEGNARPDFEEIYHDIYGNQPRSALGYYEPGHYCFITADGRNDDSRGMTLDQMGFVAQALGCTQCYNMDGGQTAQMAFHTTMVNIPAYDGRDCTDYLTIVDRVS